MKARSNSHDGGAATAPIQSLQTFCSDVGITPITAWRWERQGWIQTLNIAGRRYITAEAITKFKQRAAAGEFAKQHKTPANSGRAS